MVDGGRGGRRGSNVEGGVYKGLMSGGCQEKQERIGEGGSRGHKVERRGDWMDNEIKKKLKGVKKK